jgi:hypothetical protein
MPKAVAESLLSIAEISRRFRLEFPVNNDARRGRDFVLGGVEMTSCLTSTSVAFSETEVRHLARTARLPTAKTHTLSSVDPVPLTLTCL